MSTLPDRMGPRPHRSLVTLYAAGLLLTLGAATTALGDLGEGIVLVVLGLVALVGGVRGNRLGRQPDRELDWRVNALYQAAAAGLVLAAVNWSGTAFSIVHGKPLGLVVRVPVAAGFTFLMV